LASFLTAKHIMVSSGRLVSSKAVEICQVETWPLEMKTLVPLTT